MSGCYITATEYYTRKTEYACEFDERFPNQPNQGDQIGDSADRELDGEDEVMAHCRDCGHEFDIGRLVSVPGPMPSPFPANNIKTDTVVKAFAQPVGTGAQARIALRFFLLRSIPFPVSMRLILRVKRAVAASDTEIPRAAYTEVRDLFLKHYVPPKPWEAR